METKKKHLYYLSELSDYKIDNGYADIRGWNVKDSALRTIGKVDNLLVSTKWEKVVYLDVEVDTSIIASDHDPYGTPANSDLREFVNQKGENHIIIPIGLVDINNSEEYVFTETIDHSTFASTKRIKANTTVDRDYENAVLSSYIRGTRNRPMVDTLNEGIENAEVYREDRREQLTISDKAHEPKQTESALSDNEVDWFAAENESANTTGELPEDDNFYKGSEFDDSRFRNDL